MSSTSAAAWLESKCPATSPADRLRAARSHIRSVEEMRDLNDTVYLRGGRPASPPPQPPPQTLLVQLAQQAPAEDPRTAQLAMESSVAVAALDARLRQTESRTELSLSHIRRELEAERDGSLRGAERALVAVDDLRQRLRALEQKDLSRELGSLAARTTALEAKLAQPSRSDSLVMTEQLLRGTFDNLRDDSDKTSLKLDTACDRLARLEEQCARFKGDLDDLRATMRLETSELDGGLRSQADKLTSLDHSSTASASMADERHSALALKVEALSTDLAFAREHIARLEARLDEAWATPPEPRPSVNNAAPTEAAAAHGVVVQDSCEHHDDTEEPPAPAYDDHDAPRDCLARTIKP